MSSKKKEINSTNHFGFSRARKRLSISSVIIKFLNKGYVFTEKFFNGFGFWECLDVYKGGVSIDVRNIVLERMKKIKMDIGSWQDAFLDATEAFSATNELRDLILRKIHNLASTFYHWGFIYTNAEEGSDLCDSSLENMCKFNVQFSKWTHFIRDNSEGSVIPEPILKKMFEVAQTFKEYIFVYGKSPLDSEIRQLIYEKMKRLDLTDDQRQDILKVSLMGC